MAEDVGDLVNTLLQKFNATTMLANDFAGNRTNDHWNTRNLREEIGIKVVPEIAIALDEISREFERDRVMGPAFLVGDGIWSTSLLGSPLFL